MPTALSVAGIGGAGLRRVTSTPAIGAKASKRASATARSAFEQVIALGRENLADQRDRAAIIDGIGEAVALGGSAQIDIEHEVENEALAEPLLFREKAVIGVNIELLDQDAAGFAQGITFVSSAIASQTLSASICGATSWTRRMAALRLAP